MAENTHWHRILEGRAGLFAVLTTIAIAIGGIVEIVPMFALQAREPVLEGIEPYTPLEVAGRDIYMREGCMLCHSQMIRPMRSETLRYGEWSRADEYRYDRPFLLGSRRIGPDLQRAGGKRSDDWHYEHMRDPRSTSPGSVMPPYPWLLEWQVDPEDIRASVRTLQRLGHPYSDEEVAEVPALMEAQGREIVGRLAERGIQTEPDREIIALIAYLQRLGVDGQRALDAQAAASEGEE